ncbi:MAG: hypothetical protein B5M52_06355 [Helicobacteraceae bacterium 4484_230]|nr:MAG: hypothetical protein B5M52_06355 [Helicobacteraceae bacterium 4484_230]
MDKDLFTPTVLIQGEFHNLEQINMLSQGWDNRWTYIKGGGVQAKLWVFTTPKIQLSWVGYDNAIMIEGSHPPGSVFISFIRTKGISNFHHQKLEPYELVILRYGEEVDYLANTANEIFTIAMEEFFFDEAFYRYFGQSLEEIRKNHRLMLQEQHTDTLIRQMKKWLTYLQNKKNNNLTIDHYALIEENILESLFSKVCIKKKKVLAGHLNIEKARKILKENIDNIYDIKDLLNELNINARTLQYHFQKKLGVSPKQYFQHLRLNAIRQELLKANPNKIMVSDIAIKYGFFHSSYFSAEYKRLFRETPTQTLRYS